MKKKGLFLLALLLCVLQLNTNFVNAAEKYTYKTVQESSLTEEQKAQIVKGSPNINDIDGCDEVILVYREVATNALNTATVNGNGASQNNGNVTNPHTGLENNSILYLASGLSLVILGAYLIYKKKGNKTVATLAVVALVGISTVGVASAKEAFIEKMVQLEVGQNIEVPAEEGFEYIGYILDKKVCPIDVAEPSEEPANPPAENPGEEPAQPPADNPTDNPVVEPPAENPGEEPAQPPAENPGEEPANPPAENPGEEPAEPANPADGGDSSDVSPDDDEEDDAGGDTSLVWADK